MRELKEIIKEIRETEGTANLTEEEIPYRSRGGMLMAVRAAYERLPILLKELEEALIPHKIVALYSTGDEVILNKVSDFIKQTRGIVLDSNIMYRKIANRVEASYGANRTFTTTQYHILIQELREIALQFDYAELPAPKYQEAACPDVKSTLNFIKKIIRTTIGDELGKRYLTKIIVESVLKLQGIPKSVPILVLDVKSTEEKNLLNPLFANNNSFNFDSEFNPTPKNIVKLFQNQSKVGDEAANNKEE